MFLLNTKNTYIHYIYTYVISDSLQKCHMMITKPYITVITNSPTKLLGRFKSNEAP